MKHLLPDDIQCLIWKIYFTNIVMLDMKSNKQKSFIRDKLDTRSYLEVTRGFWCLLFCIFGTTVSGKGHEWFLLLVVSSYFEAFQVPVI